eukprot:6163678-Pleurochrysis_carterae.AAC.2
MTACPTRTLDLAPPNLHLAVKRERAAWSGGQGPRHAACARGRQGAGAFVAHAGVRTERACGACMRGHACAARVCGTRVRPREERPDARARVRGRGALAAPALEATGR